MVHFTTSLLDNCFFTFTFSSTSTYLPHIRLNRRDGANLVLQADATRVDHNPNPNIYPRGRRAVVRV